MNDSNQKQAIDYMIKLLKELDESQGRAMMKTLSKSISLEALITLVYDNEANFRDESHIQGWQMSDCLVERVIHELDKTSIRLSDSSIARLVTITIQEWENIRPASAPALSLNEFEIYREKIIKLWIILNERKQLGKQQSRDIFMIIHKQCDQRKELTAEALGSFRCADGFQRLSDLFFKETTGGDSINDFRISVLEAMKRYIGKGIVNNSDIMKVMIRGIPYSSGQSQSSLRLNQHLKHLLKECFKVTIK